MKKTIILNAFYIIATSMFGQKPTDNFTGKWKTDKGSIVEISKSKDKFIGLVQNKTVVLDNLQFLDGQWKGVMIKPEDNSQYNCTVLIDKNKLKITIKKGMMSKKLEWIQQ